MPGKRSTYIRPRRRPSWEQLTVIYGATIGTLTLAVVVLDMLA